MKNIILSGLGELDEPTEQDIEELAKQHGVQLYPTYYDWELKGEESKVEAITQAMWGMPKDQWADNGFNATTA